MLHTLVLMMPVPPIQTGTSISDMISWVMIGLILALFLVATTLWSTEMQNDIHQKHLIFREIVKILEKTAIPPLFS